jgi:hypothetical protein
LSFHFILTRAAEPANLAQVLRPHELLNWTELRQSATFVIPV